MPEIEFNPATLLLLAVLGGIFGAASTVGTYIAFRVAREVGEELAPQEARVRLPLPSGSSPRSLLPPLPHEVLAKILEGAA